MKLLPGIIILILTGFQSLSAQDIVSLNLQKNSSINVYGSSNLFTFKLVLKGDKLPEENFTIKTIRSQNKIVLGQNQLSVAVRNFTSNNKMALRDFFKLLKADNYPFMRFQLNSIEIMPNQIRAFVNITITSITKEYCIIVSASHNGDIYTITGRKSLSIKDFCLIPPVEMMGLIRVNEFIEIELNFICKMSVFQITT